MPAFPDALGAPATRGQRSIREPAQRRGEATTYRAFGTFHAGSRLCAPVGHLAGKAVGGVSCPPQSIHLGSLHKQVNQKSLGCNGKRCAGIPGGESIAVDAGDDERGGIDSATLRGAGPCSRRTGAATVCGRRGPCFGARRRDAGCENHRHCTLDNQARAGRYRAEPRCWLRACAATGRRPQAQDRDRSDAAQ